MLMMEVFVVVVAMSVSFVVSVVSAADLSNCRKSLGMHSGAIADSAITASSSYDSASVGPSNGRIRTEKNGGAWCPKAQISRDVYEWIQVDLGELKVVTQVETQGRFGNGQGQEYAEAYMLEYQRIESTPWIRFHDRKGNKVFPGNINTYIAELREINPPIIARKMRLIPHSDHPRTICLRLELYGCVWRDGVLAYNMPQGERRGTEVDLYDYTYDGRVTDHYLSGGLGQLTDGVEGHHNFRLDPDGWGHKGYEWVGWRNDSTDRPGSDTGFVEILFEFERVRNFTAVRFHANNMFNKDVRVFRRAVLWFSVSGVVYHEHTSVVFDYMRDTLIEFARNVIITVPNYVGRFVKAQLYFDARWLMISEVRFESEVVNGYVDQSTDYSILPGADSRLPRPNSSGASGSHGDDGRGFDSTFTGHNVSTGDGARSRSNSGDDGRRVTDNSDDHLIGIVAGAVVAFLAVLAAVIVFGVVCRRRIRKYPDDKAVATVPVSRLPINFTGRTDVILTSAGTTRKLSNGSVPTYGSHSSPAVAMLLPPGGADPYDDDDPVKMAPVSRDSFYRRPNDVLQRRQLPDLPRIPVDSADYLSDANTSTYAVPDRFAPPIYPAGPTPLPAALPFCRGQQDGGPAPVYGEGGPVIDDSGVYSALPGTPPPWNVFDDDQAMTTMDAASVTLPEFPRERLRYVEKLGEGLFGEIQLCEVRSPDGDDVTTGRSTSSRPSLVVVKVLNQDATDKARAEFYQDARTVACLKHANIVGLLGVCCQDEPLYAVLEYMKHGDLRQFLQARVAAESSLGRAMTTPSHRKCLSYGCLIYMATQIASGMKYLETLNVVHRDLAARNCLVGHKYTIKISDFGVCRSIFSSDYYRVESKALLPIRWMAWESVLLGEFSTKTDVWSFAVTLWEILTFARERPFDELTDDQIVANCACCYHEDGHDAALDRVVLGQPANCPREIYDLMVECWNREASQRPTFREVHMFLQRKNMGYSAADERRTPSRTAAQCV